MGLFGGLTTARSEPGNRSRTSIHCLRALEDEGDTVVEQARYTGTHTGTWRNPNGVEIPATGKTVDFPFAGVFRVTDGKISSIRIYYDQIEVLTQLGLMPGATSS